MRVRLDSTGPGGGGEWRGYSCSQEGYGRGLAELAAISRPGQDLLMFGDSVALPSLPLHPGRRPNGEGLL